jgi:hypothetical protein
MVIAIKVLQNKKNFSPTVTEVINCLPKRTWPNTGVTFLKNMISKTVVGKTEALWEMDQWNCSCY